MKSHGVCFSLSMVISRSIHVAVHGLISLFLMDDIVDIYAYQCVCSYAWICVYIAACRYYYIVLVLVVRVVTSYKSAISPELSNPKSPWRHTGLVSCKPPITSFWSMDQYITLFYMFLSKDTLFCVYHWCVNLELTSLVRELRSCKPCGTAKKIK